MSTSNTDAQPATEPGQHTPGQWTYHIGQDYTEFYDANGDTIFQVLFAMKDDFARLIAAAPDLLAAVKAAVAAASLVIHSCEEDVKRGKSPNLLEKSSPYEVMADCYAAMNFIWDAQAAIDKAEGKPEC